jgi:hypothetical protein
MNANDLQEGMQALFEDALAVALGDLDEDEIEMPEAFRNLIRVESFEDAGLLSSEPGIVLRFKDSEYQLNIIRSR